MKQPPTPPPAPSAPSACPEPSEPVAVPLRPTATPWTPEPWWPQHPMGGHKLFPDSETHEHLAEFQKEGDCDRAYICVNACAGIANPAEAIAAAREALAGLLSYADGQSGSRNSEEAGIRNNARSVLARLTPAPEGVGL